MTYHEERPTKFVIKKIDEYKVNIPGDNSYKTFKTLAEAKKQAKKWLKQEQEDWDKYEEEEQKREKERKRNLTTFKNYHKILRYRFSELFRDKTIQPTREEVLQVIRELKQIAEYKKVSEYSSWTGRYFLVDVKKVEQ